jgi:hypothetical protein
MTRKHDVTHYTFPGYPAFLEAAARQIGHPEAEAPARRITTLSALANLCAQAGTARQEQAPAVMAKAAEFRDQLHAAYRAAELMLTEVNRSLGLDQSTPTPEPPTPSRATRSPEPKGRKA